MAKNMKPVKITPESKLVPLLDEVDTNSPVLLERRGVVYQLSTVDDTQVIDDEPDAGAVRRMLDDVVGSWSDLDIDRMIEDVHRWRRDGSRSPDRP